ncbi:MAG: hypothetical protein R3338_03225 [Thermoanaerobaculia bacterium]|nr:hypothetical protein [Thermoanaerobaculia bacterium]
MSATILRVGLWSLVAILVAYLLAETSQPVAGVIPDGLLMLLTQVAFGLIALGLIVWIFEKAGFGRRSRCQICGVKIPPKSIYCRPHLNEVMEEEDLRQRTMNVRLPD